MDEEPEKKMELDTPNNRLWTKFRNKKGHYKKSSRKGKESKESTFEGSCEELAGALCTGYGYVKKVSFEGKENKKEVNFLCIENCELKWIRFLSSRETVWLSVLWSFCFKEGD